MFASVRRKFQLRLFQDIVLDEIFKLDFLKNGAICAIFLFLDFRFVSRRRIVALLVTEIMVDVV